MIVFAKPSDTSEILNFINELARFERLGHEVTATEQSLRSTLFADQPAAEVIFLEVEGKKAGFALFFHNYSTFLGQRGLYLEDLYVREEFRGRGYGQRLLAFLAKLAIERNCGRLDWSVLDWNTSALEFYARLGAQSLSDWTTQRLTGDTLARLAKSCSD